MAVRIHSHAVQRMKERGATEGEVVETVEQGESFPARFGRTGFRHNFSYAGEWRGKRYNTKQVEAYAVQERTDWLVVTVVTRYF